jgi:FKBP-type peptidyl-prolyl cis-trans isomerase 2
MEFSKGVIAVLAVIVVIIAGFLYFKYIYLVVEDGDCIEVNYIGRYTSNGTIFDTSYESVARENNIYDANKTYQPLKIFVDPSGNKTPPSGYEDYFSDILGMREGFLKDLVGMREGETKTVIVPPEKGYGIKPKIGDVLNFTEYAETDYVFRIVDIKENVPMPPLYREYYGNVTTTLYTLREDWHWVGEVISDVLSPYPSWSNSSVVTRINETKMWFYVTPTTEINENFTWIEVNETSQITFPENKSKIINITNDSITILISPSVNDTILVGIFYTPYKVERVTADKINASYTSNGNKTYREFDRVVVINRNQSRNITQEMPAQVLDSLFLSIRFLDPSFNLSLHKLAGETLTFEITVEKVHKS